MEKKHTRKIIVLMLLMFASCFGETIDTLLEIYMDYDTAGIYALLISIANTLLISVVMMAVPFICRMVNKDKLPYKKGERICLWNSIILFVLSSILLSVIETGFIGGIGAVIFYFINKWVFVQQYGIETMTGHVSNDSIPTQETEQPIRVCLSPEGEKPQSRRSFDIYGSDIRLEADNKKQEIQVKAQTVQHTLPANKSVVKYCSRCGNLIDPETKKCTGCGKQYFKGIPWKKIAVVGLIGAFVASCALNVYQYQEMNELEFNIEMRQKEISELNKQHQKSNNALREQIAALENDLSAYKAKIDFFDKHVVFVEDDGTNWYHKYECSRFVGNYYWAYNIEYAEYRGYEPCDYCFYTDSLTEEFYQAQTEREQTRIPSSTVGVRTISLTDKFTAEYIYAQLQNCKDSEDDVIAILDKYGSSQGGGQLYVIDPGYFIDEVDSWCFDPSRKRGDVAIIENAYGYSVCYFSSWL